LIPTLGKVIAGTVLMGAAVGLGWHGLGCLTLGQRMRDAIAIFGLIPAAVAIYGAILWLFKIEGREELASVWNRMRRRPQSDPQL
jgi:hypothetical protein